MLLNQSIITKTPEETKEFGEKLAEQLVRERKGERASVICLYGELGSGKTTFAQGFAKGLGVDQRLLSPTFIIVRRYPLVSSESGFLYHLDVYRLQSGSELEELGLSEIFADFGSFVLIEWAEKLGAQLPDHRIDIHFAVTEVGNHEILFTKV